MIVSIIVLLIVAGVCFAITSHAKKIEAETRDLAISIAHEEAVQNDFMYAWKRFALVVDRREKNILLCEHSGDWELIPRHECNYNINIGNNGRALCIETRDFEGENRYLFMGEISEIIDLERRVRSVLHW